MNQRVKVASQQNEQSRSSKLPSLSFGLSMFVLPANLPTESARRAGTKKVRKNNNGLWHLGLPVVPVVWMNVL